MANSKAEQRMNIIVWINAPEMNKNSTEFFHGSAERPDLEYDTVPLYFRFQCVRVMCASVGCSVFWSATTIFVICFLVYSAMAVLGGGCGDGGTQEQYY